MSFKAKHGRAAAQLIANRSAALRAQEVRNEAVTHCPVDTGRLRQSIGVQKVADDHYRVGTNVEYAPYVEFGTRDSRPQPFMRPAAEKARNG